LLETKKVFEDLYMFNSYIQPIDLTFNQYLLTGEEPLLIHTGSCAAAVGLVPKLKELLKDRSLGYIFISHFESDECGGLSYLLEHFPSANPVCSAVTARQLSGFGLIDKAIVKAPGGFLDLGGYKLQFICYPSEMHLWEGLLALETTKGILFSSDLLIRKGSLNDFITEANWPEEVQGITLEQIPNPSAREKLQQTLLNQPIQFVAPGHGPCLKLKS
jgi:flavorubredoxin